MTNQAEKLSLMQWLYEQGVEPDAWYGPVQGRITIFEQPRIKGSWQIDSPYYTESYLWELLPKTVNFICMMNTEAEAYLELFPVPSGYALAYKYYSVSETLEKRYLFLTSVSTNNGLHLTLLQLLKWCIEKGFYTVEKPFHWYQPKEIEISDSKDGPFEAIDYGA